MKLGEGEGAREEEGMGLDDLVLTLLAWQQHIYVCIDLMINLKGCFFSFLLSCLKFVRMIYVVIVTKKRHYCMD